MFAWNFVVFLKYLLFPCVFERMLCCGQASPYSGFWQGCAIG